MVRPFSTPMIGRSGTGGPTRTAGDPLVGGVSPMNGHSQLPVVVAHRVRRRQRLNQSWVILMATWVSCRSSATRSLVEVASLNPQYMISDVTLERRYVPTIRRRALPEAPTAKE